MAICRVGGQTILKKVKCEALIAYVEDIDPKYFNTVFDLPNMENKNNLQILLEIQLVA